MKKIKRSFFVLACLFTSINMVAQTVDKNATDATKNLLLNLKKNLSKGVMFGHQDDLAYGVDGNTKQAGVM